MPFLLNDDVNSGQDNAVATHKAILDATNIQTAAFEIDEFVEKEHLTYLEATSRWMEERSIPENMFSKYVPSTIVEKIKLEVVDDGLLRPSLTKSHSHSNLDFMYG